MKCSESNMATSHSADVLVSLFDRPAKAGQRHRQHLNVRQASQQHMTNTLLAHSINHWYKVANTFIVTTVTEQLGIAQLIEALLLLESSFIE